LLVLRGRLSKQAPTWFVARGPSGRQHTRHEEAVYRTIAQRGQANAIVHTQAPRAGRRGALQQTKIEAEEKGMKNGTMPRPQLALTGENMTYLHVASPSHSV